MATAAVPATATVSAATAACRRDVQSRQRGEHRRRGARNHHSMHGASSFCWAVTSQRTNVAHPCRIKDDPSAEYEHAELGPLAAVGANQIGNRLRPRRLKLLMRQFLTKKLVCGSNSRC